jgi:hypothetical protein
LRRVTGVVVVPLVVLGEAVSAAGGVLGVLIWDSMMVWLVWMVGWLVGGMGGGTVVLNGSPAGAWDLPLLWL